MDTSRVPPSDVELAQLSTLLGVVSRTQHSEAVVDVERRPICASRCSDAAVFDPGCELALAPVWASAAARLLRCRLVGAPGVRMMIGRLRGRVFGRLCVAAI